MVNTKGFRIQLRGGKLTAARRTHNLICATCSQKFWISFLSPLFYLIDAFPLLSCVIFLATSFHLIHFTFVFLQTKWEKKLTWYQGKTHSPSYQTQKKFMMEKESIQIKDIVSWIEVFPVKIIFLKDSFVMLTLLPFTNEINKSEVWKIDKLTWR